MIKMFLNYFKIGIINTLMHWSVFFLIYHFSNTQSISNSIAFIFATTFSFFMNAKFTFNKKASLNRYMLFILIMFLISILIGKVGDHLNFNPIITLMSFSGLSLVLGFLFSKYIIFRN